MRYEIITLNAPDWEVTPKAHIDSYSWPGIYHPRAFAQMALIDGRGFALKMTAVEEYPKTLYNNYNDPVYKDSCLEFFAAFNTSSPLYINFEMNSAGAYLSAVRTEKPKKTPIDKLTNRLPVVRGERAAGQWSVETTFDFSFLEELFGKVDYKPGYAFKGNFYKCGDETENPHFGSWSPIVNDVPNFHLPAYFGELVIK